MLWPWLNSSSSRTSIASPVSFPRLPSAVSLVILWRCSLLCAAAEKNCLRHLRACVPDLLRPATSACPGPLLRRQACLPRLFLAQGPLCTMWHREERTIGLARRQSAVYQAFCLLRRAPVSGNTHQRSGRGTPPRLAQRQGIGQAVHVCTTPPSRQPRSSGHWHRRDRHRQGVSVPHRGQRPGAGPGHLVRRPRSFHGEPGRVLRLAGPQEMQKNPPGGYGYVETFSALRVFEWVIFTVLAACR